MRDDRWLYVGESPNSFERLPAHLGGNGDCIAQERPGGFGFELIAEPADRQARQSELIHELEPVCNRR